MKKHILNGLLLVFPLGLMAQGIKIMPKDTLEVNYKIEEFGNDYIYVKNTSKNPMEIRYQLLKNSFVNNNWEATICTNIGCYPNIPKKGSIGTIAVGERGFFNLHSDFKGHKGTGIVMIRVYDAKDESVADTLSFLYHVNLTATTQVFAGKYNAYPNPASDVLTLETPGDLNPVSISISSLEGKLHIPFYTKNDHFIHIHTDALAPGMYLLSIRFERGQQTINKLFRKI